ncbi:MAG: FtsQ-type POTRA domain-containing protein [Synechococcales cyanobacterium K44_A2020_017]|nr:FtsQ-type POTRA domain-containing protein [Synechococcales cyanobacterium K32_A2020_035]MBF2096211.1 FtsQ-type POTRA domain-containing protein [Synechococcales cyanobacterium K44_A2020_017]
MTDLVSVSRTDLAQRRQLLRRQRRWRFLRSLWRTGLVVGMAGGLVWVTTQPVWILHRVDQVTIEGNELLSVDAIHSLLPITYPQSLLHLDPNAIADYLEAQGPIEEATVTRRLLPPGLNVQLQERRPVAVLIRGNASASPDLRVEAAATDSDPMAHVGLIDEKGFWMSLSAYVALDDSLSLPELKVRGMQEHQRSQWSQLYQVLYQSPLSIYEVDWRDPSNLVLSTELGMVHFGPYSDRFPYQLQVLDQLRTLPQHIDIGNLDYIDLRNPESPLLQELGIVPSSLPPVELLPQENNSPEPN